jgi:hypothetical protein
MTGSGGFCLWNVISPVLNPTALSREAPPRGNENARYRIARQYFLNAHKPLDRWNVHQTRYLTSGSPAVVTFTARQGVKILLS